MQNNNSKFKIKKSFKLLVVVFSFALCLLSLLPVEAASGSLYLSPSSGIYTVGDTFSVIIRVNTDAMPINAAQGTLTFPSDKLSVVGVSKSGSIFTLWPNEPTYSNSSGTIIFGGGVPNPGYTGSAGKIIGITFSVKTSGAAVVNWSSGAVLANDGKGTNILASMGGGNYTLSAEKITPVAEPIPTGAPAQPDVSSITHPDEDKWYSDSLVKFSWPLPSDVTGASILFNQKAVSNPGPLSDGLFDSAIYENVEDGIWYLHLKLTNEYGWGPIRHFRVQIDTTPPHSFTIKIKEGTEGPRPVLLFETEDDTSGISHYKVNIDGGTSLAKIIGDDSLGISEEITEAPFKMPSRPPGKHLVVIEAFDNAGNSTAATAELSISGIESPKIIKYPQHLSLGDDLILEGTSLPETAVKIYIQSEEGETEIVQTRADEKGNWIYTYDKPMNKGSYKAYAIAIDKEGTQSYPSEEVNILVSLPPLFRIGSIVIDYIVTIFVLIALITLMAFGFYWAWHRFRRFRKRLRKETEDVEFALHRAFTLLKKEMEGQLSKLEKTKDRRNLNKKEKEIERQLRRDLDVTEKYTKKEIKDIEEKLE